VSEHSPHTPDEVGTRVPGIAPWLSVPDGLAAIAFYTAAFGARERYRLPDGDRVAVAHLAVGEADFWLQEEPDVRPDPAGTPVRMILSVEDPQAVFGQAIGAGASEVYPVGEGHGWLIGRLVDPFGLHWEVGRPLDGTGG
jgi:PhnB protein